MRILQYVFTFCGNELNSTNLVSKLKGDYTICNPEEIGNVADSQGAINIAPIIESVVDDDYERVNKYHSWFALFIEENHNVLAECGADDLRIFMEVFYAQEHQCNLEIFDREVLSRISKFNVALPISIYALNENKLNEWAKEIKTMY